MPSPDRINQIMGSAIHLLDDLLESRPRVPKPVVDLVRVTLTGTAHVVGYALDRGLEATLSKEKVDG